VKLYTMNGNNDLVKPPPEAILMCKTAADSLKATSRQAESDTVIPQLAGITVIAIPDEDALRIPPLGLEHMVVGKLKDIYALLEEYDAMPGKEPK